MGGQNNTTSIPQKNHEALYPTTQYRRCITMQLVKSKRLWLLTFLFFVGSLTACVRLQLQLHKTSTQKPSNIALYFSVQTTDGDPVAGLDAKAFKIYEDEKLISPFESKQTILNPQVSVVHYVLLLLDMSGSITNSGTIPALTAAASSFTERLPKHHKLAVFGFDGREKLIQISRFTSNRGAIRSAINRMKYLKPKDPSTNLNGAVVGAIDHLEKRLMQAKQPLRFATLVVFTDGTDRAHRVTELQMQDAIKKSNANIFAIGLGVDLSEQHLALIGRTGYIKAQKQQSMKAAFQKVADYIDASSKKFYLLSYCSPSRAGVHRLRVIVDHKGLTGGANYEFDATGFGPRCDPKRPPRFNKGQLRFPSVGRIKMQ